MSTHDPDIPPAAGKRPPREDQPDPQRGPVGTGEGYSGQEYDSVGQHEWREKDRAQSVPHDGEIKGSGVGGEREEYDVGTSTGAFRGDSAG